MTRPINNRIYRLIVAFLFAFILASFVTPALSALELLAYLVALPVIVWGIITAERH